MKCGNCGANNPESSSFCGNCGAPITSSPDDTSPIDTGAVLNEYDRINNGPNNGRYNGRYVRNEPYRYREPYRYQPNRKSTNYMPVLCVTIAVLAIAIAALLFFVVFGNGLFKRGSNEDGNNADTFVVAETPSPTEYSVTAAPATPVPTPAPTAYVQPTAVPYTVTKIELTKEVGNCKQSVTLRSGPSTSYSEITQVPLGASVYCIESTSNGFTLVTYNGKKGYIASNYIVALGTYDAYHTAKYSDSAIESFVEGSLSAFVNGVTNKDSTYVYRYYSGSAAEEEMRAYNDISAIVKSEEILSLSCHSVDHISSTQATVIRDSVIRVTYNDGTVKDITERYKYTVDLSGSNMYIVALTEM